MITQPRTSAPDRAPIPQAVPAAPPRPTPPAPAAAAPRRRRARGRLILAGLIVAAVATIGASRALLQPAPQPAAPATRAASELSARGELRPAARAKIGTLSGGVLRQLLVRDGDLVDERQEIARVEGVAGMEVLTAPWQGTVSGTLAHVGDTVLPGGTIVTVADLSRLQVETTDVDEFLVGHVRAGQQVRITVDALDGRVLRGRVWTVAAEPQLTSDGDQHYPVAIELQESSGELRPGMTVRVSFVE